jgi:hypothetical protein
VTKKILINMLALEGLFSRPGIFNKMPRIFDIIKLRLPEIQLLAVVPTQLKFRVVKDHDEPTILLFETLFFYVGVFQYGIRVSH